MLGSRRLFGNNGFSAMVPKAVLDTDFDKWFYESIVKVRQLGSLIQFACGTDARVSKLACPFAQSMFTYTASGGI